jgi:hypothetical protein
MSSGPAVVVVADTDAGESKYLDQADISVRRGFVRKVYAILSLQLRTIEVWVKDRFGPLAPRILRRLLDRGMLEEKMVADLVLAEAKKRNPAIKTYGLSWVCWG